MEDHGIAIDWAALESAFENHSPEVRSYLDADTGEVVSLLGRDDNSDLAQSIHQSPDRFLRIEPIPSREQYRIMERFIASVPYPSLAARLSDAIVGKGAFRRFKDSIAQHVEERKRWFAYRDVLVHQYILDWCRAHDLEWEVEPEWALELPPTPDPTEEVEEAPPEEVEGRPETVELKSYLQSWSRAHGEEYQYIFGPAAFDRLAEDLTQEFNLFRRR